MTLDTHWPWNYEQYRMWSLTHPPRKAGLQDYWIGMSPDFHYEERNGCEDIIGSFITAPDRMALLNEIDRSMM